MEIYRGPFIVKLSKFSTSANDGRHVHLTVSRDQTWQTHGGMVYDSQRLM